MEQSQNKLPLFIACKDPKIIKELDEMIKTIDDQSSPLSSCELVVINTQIQEKLNEQYYYSLLDKEKQRQIQEIQNDEVQKSKALSSAKLLCNILSLAEKGRNYQKDN